MLEHRIVLESDEAQSKRYDRYLHGLQRAYETAWELKETFRRRLFGDLVEYTYKQLEDAAFEKMGRRRFLRVVGSIKIPLTSIRE